MTQKERLSAMYRAGKADALTLRAEAKELTGTQIIDREWCVPSFDPEKDYSEWPVGSPVSDGGQIWTLIQSYNAAHYAGRPADLRALWGLCHTTNPSRAKAWVDPYGTSGLYLLGECYRDGDTVYRCIVEQTNFDAQAVPGQWEAVK